MSPYRFDPATGEGVLVAPGRWLRPDVHAAPVGCPFCAGHEDRTPPELARLPAAAGGGSWRVRVVPNRYPLVDGHDGRHEVVVESPEHDWDYRLATAGEVADVLAMLRERSRAALADDPGAVIAFRNRHQAAGESIAHPHSQLVALARTPARLRQHWRRARQQAAATGRPLHQAMVLEERHTHARIVADEADVVTFQPFATRARYETWIVPLGAGGDFAAADDATLRAVARALRALCAGVYGVLGDVAYNLVVRSGPPGEDSSQWWRWHLVLRPRLDIAGGFELGTGLDVTTMPPEDTAPRLRAAVAAAGA